MAAIAEVVRKVLANTKANKIAWKTTALEQRFLALVGSNGISVEQVGPIAVEAFKFSVEGADGQTIDTITTFSPEAAAGLRVELRELYELARRKALNVDRNLDDLLKVLNG